MDSGVEYCISTKTWFNIFKKTFFPDGDYGLDHTKKFLLD